MSELETLEWRDALSGEGQSELNSHYVVEEMFWRQSDWPKRRVYIMERLDMDLGLHIIEALKRGWRAENFERWTWCDDDMRPRLKQPSASEYLLAVKDWAEPPSFELEPPPIPDWLKREIYGPAILYGGLYHIRTRITVIRP
jgi:hypothetical protein